MEQPIQPIVPEGTPLPTPPVGVPPYPITPFAVWTWNTPVIPQFYWNIYSSEQRIKSICKEIGKIEAYLQYLVTKTNANIIEIHQRIDALTERVAALEKKVEEEVARLDALIAKLREDLEQEIADREAGDAALDSKIEQEIIDRVHGDETLHGEITAEATARIHADDTLHEEISTEVQDRIHADDQLHQEISKRLLPTDVQAGAEIEITRPDPNSNTLVIASTVAHSIADLAATVSGIQAALTAETEERRADDAALWTAVNQRIERGKILAGTGIKVENDPDSSTVTISATGGGTGGSTTVAGTAPVEVTGTPEEGYTVGVAAATEEEPGVITEARVKELAPSYTAGSGISISGNQISIAPSGSQAPWTEGVNNRVVAEIIRTNGTQAGKVSSNLQFEPGTGINFSHNGSLKISAKNATESDPGIISEARVKELASGTTVRGTNPISVGGTPQDGYNVRLKYDPNAFKLNGEYLTLKIADNTPMGVNTSTSGNPGLYVNKATKTSDGVISEDRVRELAGSVAPSLSAESPLKLEEGTISLTKDPAGPVTSSAAGLSVREITPETESESEAGVVSKATIAELARYSGAVNPEYALDGTHPGGLRVLAGPGMDFGEPKQYESGEETPTGSKGLGVSRALPNGDYAESTLIGRFVISPQGDGLPEPGEHPLWVGLSYANHDLKVASTMVFPWLDPSDYDVEVRAMPDPTGVFWRFYVRKVDGSAFPSDSTQLREVNLHLSVLTFANYTADN